MIFDLRELSSVQQDLDDKIAENHNVKQADTINERILAFLVELGELANETRCFKYWSIKGPSSSDVVLEEYVDGIHFLISLCNQLKQEVKFEVNKSNLNTTDQFIKIFGIAGELKDNFSNEKLIELFTSYLILGDMLGFDNDIIVKGYFEKNELNHKRQEENY